MASGERNSRSILDWRTHVLRDIRLLHFGCGRLGEESPARNNVIFQTSFPAHLPPFIGWPFSC